MERRADTEPIGSDPLILSILTNNTRGTETSHQTKRPLKGLKRRNLDKNLHQMLDQIGEEKMLTIWSLVVLLHQIYTILIH